jgi:hypothetical protein
MNFMNADPKLIKWFSPVSMYPSRLALALAGKPLGILYFVTNLSSTLTSRRLPLQIPFSGIGVFSVRVDFTLSS